MLQINKTLLDSKITEVQNKIKSLIIGLNEHIAYGAKVAEITAHYFAHGAYYGFDEAVKRFEWIDAKGTTKPAEGEVVIGKINFTDYVFCKYDATAEKWIDINQVEVTPVDPEAPVVEEATALIIHFFKYIETAHV